MKVDIVCAGKLKESYFSWACEEYIKRLKRFCDLKIIEVPDSPLDNEQSLKDEGARMLKHISGFVITLEIGGKNLSSVELNQKIGSLSHSYSKLCFVIGGSRGLSQAVLSRSDFALSFGAMTFPHQLMRVMLLEQIYRAFSIENNLPYHK